ncbi:hypothetical protein QQF64_006505 [Cirrhinus molitorella]|uniref:G-protein coupled receptors family 1 profile domain-containing protein n=1 Tax=Cirrhinus molitorella TaxID=172907 RepID=A0ABR3M8T1_9TELE
MLNYFSLVVGFIIPFLVILLCYAGILRTLLRNNNSANKQRYTRNKAIRMIVVVMLAFLVSFMPYHIQRTLHLHFKNRKTAKCEEIIYMQKSVVITLCLAAANSCFDPMLYFFIWKRTSTSTNNHPKGFWKHQCNSQRPPCSPKLSACGGE